MNHLPCFTIKQKVLNTKQLGTQATDGSLECVGLTPPPSLSQRHERACIRVFRSLHNVGIVVKKGLHREELTKKILKNATSGGE